MKNKTSVKRFKKIESLNTGLHLPKDYPWKVLSLFFKETRNILTEDEQVRVSNILHSRDIEALELLIEDWSPQSINSGGISTHEFALKYQVAALLKKWRFPSDSQSRKTTALQKFREAEVCCADFNENTLRLANIEDPQLLAVYTYAKQFLSKLLGEELPGAESLTEWSRHGPGSNLDTDRSLSSLYDKYLNWPYSCTKSALGHARLAIENDERWRGALEDNFREREGIPKHVIIDQDLFFNKVLKVVDGNRITFVPKSAKTDRTIAIEPAMNLYLQLGVDGFIRRRLKRWGVDLDNQEKNQSMAREGSVKWQTDDPYVTLDLSAASDTIATKLCYLLLPPQWYTYLMELRSPIGECNGEIFTFEKISSMGNGYTFALESAIFQSIVYGCERLIHRKYDSKKTAVYGDDIIIRRSTSGILITMLNLCGFSINDDKSFFDGPFRESCGADWFKGTSVRPVFLTERPTTIGALWCDINRIRRVSFLRGWGDGDTESHLLTTMESWIPMIYRRYKGPFSDEDFDSYLHVDTPVSPYNSWIYRYPRLVITYKKRAANEFLIRKLMHSLRLVSDPFPRAWGGMKLTDAGSRFTVQRKNSVIVRDSYGETSYWSRMYNDLLGGVKPF